MARKSTSAASCNIGSTTYVKGLSRGEQTIGFVCEPSEARRIAIQMLALADLPEGKQIIVTGKLNRRNKEGKQEVTVIRGL